MKKIVAMTLIYFLIATSFSANTDIVNEKPLVKFFPFVFNIALKRKTEQIKLIPCEA
jgi:hypothetical protein